MKLNRYTFLAFTLLSSTAYSLDDLNAKLFSSDENKNNDKTEAFFFLGGDDYNIELDGGPSIVNGEEVENENLVLEPNNGLSVGASANYKGLSLSGAIPTPADDTDVKGKTRSFDFKTSYFFTKEWGLFFGYQTYRGFFEERFVEGQEDPKYAAYPDVRKKSHYLNALYAPEVKIFAKKYTTYEVKLLPVFTAGYSSYEIANLNLVSISESFQLNQEFQNELATTNKMKYTGLGATVGIISGLKFKQAELSISIALGGSKMKRIIQTNETQESDVVTEQSIVNLSYIQGFNNEWKMFLNYGGVKQTLPLENGDIVSDIGSFKIGAGKTL